MIGIAENLLPFDPDKEKSDASSPGGKREVFALIRMGRSILLVRADPDSPWSLPRTPLEGECPPSAAGAFLRSHVREILGCYVLMGRGMNERGVPDDRASRLYFHCLPSVWSSRPSFVLALPPPAQTMLWSFDSPSPKLDSSLLPLVEKMAHPAFWLEPDPRRSHLAVAENKLSGN